MHQAQSYIDNHLKQHAPNSKLSQLALNATQAAALKLSLDSDFESYLYSGSVSIADAIQAIDRSLYTWATVKLYYAVFYLARSLLASHGTVMFYDGTKPYSWNCTAGAFPTKRNGPTHKAVLSTFADVLPNSPLLSQPINSVDALAWMMSLRESANYTNAKFCEPDPPNHFKIIAREGVRKSLSAYASDTTYLYTFDPQHAMIALPVEALKEVFKSHPRRQGGTVLKEQESRYLSSLYFDKKGPLSDLVLLLSS